jgi:tight adherence protein B
MLQGNMAVIVIAIMGAVAFGGLAYVFLDPFLSGERRAQKRMRSLADGKRTSMRNRAEELGERRRRNVQDSLKELEEKQKERRRADLRTMIERAGLTMSRRTFWLFSGVFGFAVAILTLTAGIPIYVAAGAWLAAALGVPRWVLTFLRKRRQYKFMDEFANSLDVIVRGVKAGLPINDCLQMIAREARQPVAGEFRLLVESQRIGIPLDQGLDRMTQRMPIPEVNFFAIVLAIQRQSGGNLAEVLGNLSRVLRDRKKMKGKIRALSQEAKSSAAIIGALPVFIMVFMYMSSPDYIELLWTEPLGHLMLAGSAFWMLCGVMVMKQMMDFEI